ncbi:MAG: hypothetical protein MR740_01725 [Clostridium sp.]|nr:hypothetical protein [Clostridium sp.]
MDECSTRVCSLKACDILYRQKVCYQIKTVNASGIELMAEINLDGEEAAFLNDLQRVDGISAATLVSYNGEYMS